MTLDAHHHFWRYSPAAYGWIDDRMAAIRRDFLPDDLAPVLGAAGLDGAVSVQARQTLEETRWLLALARRHDVVRGVVGWVPLTDPDVDRHLARLAADPGLVGVRHVLHDEPDDDYMLREDFNRGVARLAHYGLAYDVLIFARHLPRALAFVDRHPGQVFVVDHLAKPRIRDGALQPWKDDLRRLAERPNVYCKVSGLVTEADWTGWTPAQLVPYWDAALEAFGPHRLLFGSDWPVCLVASTYRRWHDVVQDLARALSEDERARLFGGTAAEAYGL